MGQHKTNPVAQAAARGEIAPKLKASAIRLMDWSALKSWFMPKRHDRDPLPPRVTRAERRRRANRRAAARLRMMTPLFPPKSGHRRAEFSSKVAGKWSKKNGRRRDVQTVITMERIA